MPCRMLIRLQILRLWVFTPIMIMMMNITSSFWFLHLSFVLLNLLRILCKTKTLSEGPSIKSLHWMMQLCKMCQPGISQTLTKTQRRQIEELRSRKSTKTPRLWQSGEAQTRTEQTWNISDGDSAEKLWHCSKLCQPRLSPRQQQSRVWKAESAASKPFTIAPK